MTCDQDVRDRLLALCCGTRFVDEVRFASQVSLAFVRLSGGAFRSASESELLSFSLFELLLHLQEITVSTETLRFVRHNAEDPKQVVQHGGRWNRSQGGRAHGVLHLQGSHRCADFREYDAEREPTARYEHVRADDPTRQISAGLTRPLGIYAYGYESPSAVQSRAIVQICKGRDTIAQAQSGTGKTATFSISILQVIDTAVRETQGETCCKF